MFEVDDIVLYGTQGLCRIAEIAERTLQGPRQEYYVLRPIFNDRSTLYIPRQSETLTAKMHPIPDEATFTAMLREIPGQDDLWLEEEAARRTLYRETVSGGNCRELLRLSKTLRQRQQSLVAAGRKLKYNDENMMREAERILCEEMSYLLHIDLEQALPLLLARIRGEVEDGQG